jgi:hydroxyquinol 1,2-dioxygenase
MIDTPDYDRLVTHLFKEGTEYLDNDVVFGVKPELITTFKKMPPGKTPAGTESATPFYAVNYNFTLNDQAAAQEAV